MIISFCYHIPALHGSRSRFRFTLDLLAASFAESKVLGEKLPNTALMCESAATDREELDTFSLNGIIYIANQKSLLSCSTQPTWSKTTGDVKRAHRADWWSLHEDPEMASQRSSDFPGAVSPCFTEITQSTSGQFQTVINVRDSRDDLETLWIKKKKERKTTRVSGVPIVLLSQGSSWLLEAPSVPGRGPSVEGQRGGDSLGWAELRQELLIKQEGSILAC